MVEGKEEIAYRFWTAVSAIPGFGEEKARERTVSAQPVVLKAIAKLIYDLKFSNRRPTDGDNLTELLLCNVTEIDFSHDNPMWRYYSMSKEDRIKRAEWARRIFAHRRRRQS